MCRKLLYHVKFNEGMEAEGRRFYTGEKYPVYKKDDEHVILCAENGEFCFSNDLMEQAIDEWELTVINPVYLHSIHCYNYRHDKENPRVLEIVQHKPKNWLVRPCFKVVYESDGKVDYVACSEIVDGNWLIV